jgi:hypothetical protein
MLYMLSGLSRDQIDLFGKTCSFSLLLVTPQGYQHKDRSEGG